MVEFSDTLEKYEPEKDFNLHIMEYGVAESDGGDSLDQSDQARQFSDRKVKVEVILDKSETKENPRDNILYRDKAGGKLRYVHLPANNMIVGTFLLVGLACS